MINIQQGMSPQLYMSMHGLNNLYNINVQLERLNNINDLTTTTTTATTTHDINYNDSINNNVRHQQQ